MLPGESVLGVDIPETVTFGAENARLGAAVSTDGSSIVALAPGSGQVWRDGALSSATVFATGFTADRGAWEAGEEELRFLATGEVFAIAPDERALVSDPTDAAGRVYVLGPAGVREAVLNAVVWLARDLDGIAVEGDQLAARACSAESCSVSWRSFGLEKSADIPAEQGGGLGWRDGVLCSGNPEANTDDGAGFVECTDGTRQEGLVGDHLGRAISGAWATGEFNKWIVPARTRVVPIFGGEVFAIERGGEAQPTTLAEAGTLLVIGQPFEMHGGMNTGAVHVVVP